MILITGGSGILGSELRKILHKNRICYKWFKHKIYDIRSKKYARLLVSRSDWLKDSNRRVIKLIVHCAAFTDLARAEKEKKLCYQTNVIGTRNLASLGIPMLYISTEYVFDGEKGNYAEEDYPNPQNFYSFTKLLGEYESRRTRSVVIRCLFKARPFEHAFGCIDKFTSGDYVDKIAPEIALAIKKFDELPPTLHIGFERKNMYDLARQSRDVKPISVLDIKEVKIPKDTSLNTSKWENFKREHRLCES